MDKLDKIGPAKVREELIGKGFTTDELERIDPFMQMQGNVAQKITFLEKHLEGSETGLAGVREMRYIFERLQILDIADECELDITLARGLNYYTGTIFEVKATETEIGSICGGGRYDELTGIFGLPGVSGVGISFGADRIYDVLLALNRFPEHDQSMTQVLLVNFGDEEEKFCLKVARQLRDAGIITEIFPEQGKLKKQMKYADQKQIPFVVLAGEKEITDNLLTVKDMKSGEQYSLNVDDLIRKLKT